MEKINITYYWIKFTNRGEHPIEDATNDVEFREATKDNKFCEVEQVFIDCNLPEEEKIVFIVKRDSSKYSWKVTKQGEERIYFTFHCDDRSKFTFAFKEAYSNKLVPPDY